VKSAAQRKLEKLLAVVERQRIAVGWTEEDLAEHIRAVYDCTPAQIQYSMAVELWKDLVHLRNFQVWKETREAALAALKHQEAK
jgi:hypothetical protein